MKVRAEALERRLLCASWYVSATSGSDLNAGTLSRPFQTIQRAANLAQPGDTVFIRGGTYRESVSPAHSGLPGAPIVFEPYQNEKVTIDGADPVTGWSNYQGSIWQTHVPSSFVEGQNQLFLDGQMVSEAAWPNGTPDPSHPAMAYVTSATTPVVGSNGIATITIGVPLTDPAGTWVGATIHIAPGQAWVTQTGTVIASAPGTLTYQYQPLDDAEVPTAGNHFYLTGLFRTLNSPGSWFIDNSGNAYLWASQGDNPSTHTVEVKHRLYAFDLSGHSNIDVIGLNLFACTINTDTASANVRIDGINAQYLSNNFVNPYAWYDQDHPHTQGIILNGANDTVENSTLDYSTGDGVFVGGPNDTVSNCLIANTDYAGGEEAGVFILAPNALVTGNTIYNCGRSGIVYRLNPGAQILHNLIHDVGIQDTDLGGIYTYNTNGQGARIAYNQVYNVHTGGFGAGGIYLDNFSQNFIVDHNVAWNCDYALKMNPPCTNDLIYNNTLSGTQNSVASSGDFSMPGCVFRNNIFTGSVQIGSQATLSNNLTSSINPLFVDAASDNYQLAAGSPAIDAGTAVSPYTDGYLGLAPDDGAYESGAPAWTAGSTLPPIPVPTGAMTNLTPPANRQNVNDPFITAAGGIELGLKFRSDVAGTVSGVRFWKGSLNIGTHVGQLWSTTGQLLATATFSNETASGWQTASFSPPVPIAAGTTYVIAYHTTAPYIAYTPYALTSTGIDAPPLHILADGVDGRNGVMAYDWTPNTPSFPSSANTQQPNYWVDPVFVPASTPLAPAAPTGLLASSAQSGQISLSWTAAAGTVTAYHVERSIDGINFADVADDVQGTSYVDQPVAPGVQYVYQVRAEDAGSFSPYSNAQSVTAAGISLLSTPGLSGFVAQHVSGGVQLNWSAFPLAGIVTYDIFRGTTPGGEGAAPIATISGSTTFLDSSALPGTTYYYQIATSSIAGTSPRTGEAVAARLMGDVNEDGTVNLADLLILTHDFGQATGATWSAGDLDGDGTVGLSDLLLLARNFGARAVASSATGSVTSSVSSVTPSSARRVSA